MIGLSHINLDLYYRVNFVLAKQHNISISEIEDMYPFERDLYTELVKDYIRRQEEENERRNQ